jgi:hypothetical protein
MPQGAHMRAARRSGRLGFLAALVVGAGGCGLNVTGEPSGDAGDMTPDGLDGDISLPDDGRDDSREDAGEDGRDEAAEDGETPICITDEDCDDGVDCTVDTCTPGAGTCSFAPSDAFCDDGDACTGEETCDAVSGCVSGTPVDCTDGFSCTDDLCDPATGVCSWSLDHTRCTEPQLCDPPRTGDATGCANPPVCTTDDQCADADLCNGIETCGADLLCKPGTPVVCNDGVACTTDSCAPATGLCSFVPPDADGDTYIDAACSGTDCDDTQPGIHPGATEICNGIDDNCNVTIDDGATCTALPNSTVDCVGGSCIKIGRASCRERV